MPLTTFDVVFRPPALEDAAEVAEVVNACAVAETGTPETTPDEIVAGWSTPGREIRADDLVATDSAGRIVATISADLRADGAVRLDGYVHPSWNSRGVGTRLLAWGERRALELSSNDVVSIHHGVVAETPAARLLERRGFVHVRTFLDMTISLDDADTTPVWPDGIIARPFPDTGLSLREVYDSVREAFDDHWGGLQEDLEAFVHRISDGRTPPASDLWFIATGGSQIAGTIFLREQSAHDPASGWVRYVAVRRPWRGRGLGRALLLHAFGVLRERGLERAELFVDSENLTGAARLYESAGMRTSFRVHAYEKMLRRER